MFRRVCRFLHRELGFLTVGLTLVYGISGLAVNHAHHWDANYRRSSREMVIEPVGTGPTAEITPVVLSRLQPPEAVKNTWRAAPDKLQVFVEGGQYDVNLNDGRVVRSGFARRPVLWSLNFMHLNSGHGPWTGIADAYAGILILLAITGIFLTKGRKGLVGRGGLLMVLGFLLPLVYAVVISGATP